MDMCHLSRFVGCVMFRYCALRTREWNDKLEANSDTIPLSATHPVQDKETRNQRKNTFSQLKKVSTTTKAHEWCKFCQISYLRTEPGGEPNRRSAWTAGKTS